MLCCRWHHQQRPTKPWKRQFARTHPRSQSDKWRTDCCRSLSIDDRNKQVDYRTLYVDGQNLERYVGWSIWWTCPVFRVEGNWPASNERLATLVIIVDNSILKSLLKLMILIYFLKVKDVLIASEHHRYLMQYNCCWYLMLPN